MQTDPLPLVKLAQPPHLDGDHPAREHELHQLQHLVDNLLCSRYNLHVHRNEYFCMQTPSLHLLNSQCGVCTADQQLTQPSSGSIATLCTQSQANRTSNQIYSKNI